jgi:hypothetical protein
VATAVQILLLRFRTSGIIFFGSSGSLDEKILVPGDVAVPKAVAFTGVWEWKVRQAFAIIYCFRFKTCFFFISDVKTDNLSSKYLKAKHNGNSFAFVLLYHTEIPIGGR